jgi:3-oxoacyl-[acyl-carrier protein] reductase
VVSEVVTRRGPLDILVANHARGTANTLDDITAAELDRSFAVNARGAIQLAQVFARQFQRAHGGRIVLLTSGQHTGAMPSELAYAVSKGAIHQATRTLAAHLMPAGITVNTINPGPTDTGWADEETRAHVAALLPTGR